MNTQNKYYTLEEVAKKLRVVYMTVYRWVRNGKLSAYKFGKQYMVKEEDLEDFIQNSKYKIEK